MQDLRITWIRLQEKLELGSAVVTYIDANGNYYLYSLISGIRFVCVLDKSSDHASEFEDNYKAGSSPVI